MKVLLKLSCGTVLIGIFLLACLLSPSIGSAYHPLESISSYLGGKGPLIGDAFIPPDLPSNPFPHLGLAAPSPAPTPGYYETSEYMIGSVAVSVILVESDGSIDPSTEDWTPYEESQVHDKIEDALSWWASQNLDAHVNFTCDYYYGVPVGYEPINRASYQEGMWISQAMEYLGYKYGTHFRRVRNYLRDLRNTKETDWAFTMFVVDSSTDIDGCFTDDKGNDEGKMFAYAYLGGPFLVMTYDNDGWGISRMNRVCAHEIGHIFYATDEYDDESEYSGYLNVADIPNSNCLMDSARLCLSSGTKGQIGWRDTDEDGILDIVDTHPDSFLQPCWPNPTTETILDYTGSVSEEPYPNSNPRGNGRDVTINHITGVEYRVDSGDWYPASPSDGHFDEVQESFHFTTPNLSLGIHTIEVRSINSEGNTDTSFPSDTVTVLSYDYDITSWPDNLNMAQGQGGYFDIYVDLIGSSSETVNLTLVGLPGDVGNWTIVPYSGKPPFSSKVVITTFQNAEVGTCDLEVWAESEHHESSSNPFHLIVVDVQAPSSEVHALAPNILNTTFVVSWSGTDNPGGSGVAYYDVQLREGSGEWTDWLTSTTLTSSNFTGEMCRIYSFRCRAWDKSGNREEYPEGRGDTKTTLGLTLTVLTHYQSSQVLIEGYWYTANETGDLEIPLLPGTYAVEVLSILDLAEGERAVFMGWGDGNLSNPRYLNMVSNQQLTANFYDEYRLDVLSQTGFPRGSGWYHADENASFSADPIVDYGNGTRDIFSSWSGDVNSDSPNCSIMMTGARSVTAGWDGQCYLNLESSFGSPTGTGWYPEGSEAFFSVEGLVDHGNHTRRVFDFWSGDTFCESNQSQIVMNGAKMIRASWVTEHYLKLESRYVDPVGESWYPEGSLACFSVTPEIDLGNASRVVFTEWTGDLKTNRSRAEISMTAPKSMRACWKRQYTLKIKSKWGDLPDESWKDAGARLTVSLYSSVDHGNGTRRVFSAWEGDVESDNTSIKVNMTGPITISALWETQHLVGVLTPYGTPEGVGWYIQGGEARISVPSVLDCGNGTRRVFVDWDVGMLPKSPNITLTVMGPLNLSVLWETEYYLKVDVVYTSSQGEAWYADGATARFSIREAVSVGNMTRHTFQAWKGSCSSPNIESTTLMDGPKRVFVEWRTEHYLNLTSAYSTPTGEGWYEKEDLASFSVEPVIEFTNGTRHVCDGWSWNSDLLGTSDMVRMSGPTHLMATWHTEYYFKLFSPHGCPKGEGWHRAGTETGISVESPIDHLNKTRLVFKRWTGDLDCNKSQALLIVDSPKTITALWTTEYAVDIAFLDHEGRSVIPDSIVFSDLDGRRVENGPGPLWLEQGMWRVVSVIWRGFDVAPPGKSLTVNGPCPCKLECEIYDIEFKLVDLIGLPIWNAWVEMTLPNGTTILDRTGRDGVCILRMIPTGEYTAAISAFGLERMLSGIVDRNHTWVLVKMHFSLFSLLGVSGTVVIAGAVLIRRARISKRSRTGKSIPDTVEHDPSVDLEGQPHNEP